jgi:hypothetical protein
MLPTHLTMNITPTHRFQPMSPFLEMLIAHARERLTRPEGLAPASITNPRRIDPDPAPSGGASESSRSALRRLDRSV